MVHRDGFDCGAMAAPDHNRAPRPDPEDLPARRVTLQFLVWGDFCQGGAPRVLSIFLSLSFFVRPGRARFFIPTRRLMAPAARRSGQGWRVSATEGLSLRAPSMTAHLARVGDEDIEGSPRVVHDCSCHILVCGGYRDPDHDAVMRIGSKLRGGGPILTYGMQAMESAGAPPPRTVIGDLSQTVPTGSETFRSS